MAFTQAQRDSLAAAIATGAKTVSYADRTVTYHSLTEMISLLAVMDADLAGSQATAGRSTFATFRRGTEGSCGDW